MFLSHISLCGNNKEGASLLFLFVFSELSTLQVDDNPQKRRLLCVLLLWQRALPAEAKSIRLVSFELLEILKKS